MTIAAASTLFAALVADMCPATRAMGLDCGPMSGFDRAALDKDFFAGSALRSNFLCALGHGADEPFERLPRLGFDEACSLI